MTTDASRDPVTIAGLELLIQQLHTLPIALFEASPTNATHDPLVINANTGHQVIFMKRNFTGVGFRTIEYRVFIVVPDPGAFMPNGAPTMKPVTGLFVNVDNPDPGRIGRNVQAVAVALRYLKGTTRMVIRGSVDLNQWPNLVAR